MSRLLAGELIKVRTTRTALGFGVAALLLALASVLISILAGDPVTIRDKHAALGFGTVISIVLLIYGVVGATGEFRHRTLAPAVLIAPDRFRLVVARIGAYALTAGVVAAVIGLVTFVIGIPLLADTSGPDLDGGDYAGVVVGGLLTVVLCAALGVGLGTLVRNQVGAVVGVLIWIFVFDPLIITANDDWSKYTIGTAAGALGQGGNVDARMLTAALVLAAWTVAVCTAGAIVDRRRDVE
jgi:hypothetical protein